MDRLLDLVAMNSAQTIHAFVHVFGSVSGYTTLGCDPGISATDRQALELLGFGQTDDPAYLASLDDFPAALGRPLPSGRYALTRCFLGPPDSAGRTTLRFVSLVFESRDWVQCVSFGVWSVLKSSAVWSWTNSSSPTTARVTVTPSSIDSEYKNDLLAMLNGWIHARTTRSVCVCRDNDRSRQFVVALPCLLPPSDRAGFRWGVGLLAPGSVADICTLSPTADTSSRRPLVWLPSPQVGTAPYASALSHFWHRGAPLPAHFVSNTASSLSFANSVVDDDSASLPATAARSSRTRSLVLASIAIALGVGVPLTLFFGFFHGGPSASPVADTIANTAGDPSATPPTPTPDATDPAKELATNVEHHAKDSDSTSQDPPESLSDPTLAAPRSSPTRTEPGLPEPGQDHPSSIAPIESISITPAPARPADATPTGQGLEPDPEWPPETLSREDLLARLEEAADAAKRLDRLSSSATEPAAPRFAPIETLLRWHYTKEQIKRYNSLQLEVNDRDRKLIEDNDIYRRKLSIINSVIERSSEYHARQLINEYNLDDSTKQNMNPDSAEFRKLQLASNRLFRIHPKGSFVINVHKNVERISKHK
jgi:hypothetical protein